MKFVGVSPLRRNKVLFSPLSFTMEPGKNTDWKKHAKQFNLEHKLENFPNECSVGQRQRFTLLRAIHSGKSVLLCDEPLSGVDSDTALKICEEFTEHVEKNKKTVLWVTHNQTEAEQLGEIIKLK